MMEVKSFIHVIQQCDFGHRLTAFDCAIF